MKKIISILFLVLLFTYPHFSLAQETIVFNPSSPKDAVSTHTPEDFAVLVNASGNIVSKTGTLFSVGNPAGLDLPYLISTAKLVQYPGWALRQG